MPDTHRSFINSGDNHSSCKMSGSRRLLKTNKIFFALFFTLTGLLLLPNNTFAQEGKDSLALVAKKRSNRVALMSAILPGSGQVANKKYWKVPIIYAGGAVLVYFIKTNNEEYQNYKEALIVRNDGDSTTVDNYPFFTNDDLKTREDYYRRNRDLSYILAGALYVLNIIDAYVDSQMMDFDVSDNLSLKINPSLNTNKDNIPVPSINLVLNFK